MVPAVKRQIDVNRLRADVSAASVELLSAHCASDRMRLQYSPQEIAAYGDPQALQRAIASVQALHRFFSQVEAHIRHEPDNINKKR